LAESPDSEQRNRFERSYVWAFAIGAALVSILPNLIAMLLGPPGSVYQGFQWAADDHYVYAAWMRQAMEGRLLMDNRFAVDAQPGLTIHLYFFALGLIAKVTGIPVAMAIGKMLFSGLFVFLSHRLLQRVSRDTYTTKLALAVLVLGGGIGFLVWESFGPELERASPFASVLSAFGVQGAPIDVWQPEAFVFPSLLTNGLFMVSLCLILGVFLSFLEAKDSWRSVLPGALMMALLMNIHSYDVLLIAMVMIAFLAMQMARRAVDWAWVGRSGLIALGALPPALWFWHVLRNDAVFQARAATPTYSPNFRMLFIGCALMIGLSSLVLLKPSVRQDKRRLAGIGIASALIAALYFSASTPGGEGFFLSMPVWLAAFAISCIAAALIGTDNIYVNLVVAWAIVGLVAPYFPALFERKLTMGLSIPWAILAAAGIASLTRDRDRSRRNLITVLSLLVIGGTSMRWFFREIELAKLNVSNTTVHSVYISRDVQAIAKYLNDQGYASKRAVVIALPGVPQKNQDAVDSFSSPLVPDINPVLSGLTGVYTFAGHWSETPDYIARRNESTLLFLNETPDQTRRDILAKSGADFIVAPDPNAFPGIADLSSLGTVVAGGNQFRLIRLDQN
jgi:hypothetical protein